MSTYNPSMSYSTYASNYMPSTAAGPGSASMYPPSTSIDQGSASSYPPSTSANQASASSHPPSTSSNPASSNVPSWVRFAGTTDQPQPTSPNPTPQRKLDRMV